MEPKHPEKLSVYSNIDGFLNSLESRFARNRLYFSI
jgi:hypothetical protein